MGKGTSQLGYMDGTSEDMALLRALDGGAHGEACGTHRIRFASFG